MEVVPDRLGRSTREDIREQGVEESREESDEALKVSQRTGGGGIPEDPPERTSGNQQRGDPERSQEGSRRNMGRGIPRSIRKVRPDVKVPEGSRIVQTSG